MLTLNDGRSELWQWDTGRTLAVDADCSQVHFSNKVFGRSIDVDVVDGVAIIPDILLQTDNDLNVWAFAGTAENGYTKISKIFTVNRRNKPADYAFTPTDQMTLQTIQRQIGDLADLTTEAKENLVAAINEAARSGGGGGGSTVELDTTLTQSGKAADAKAAGDALSTLSEEIEKLQKNRTLLVETVFDCTNLGINAEADTKLIQEVFSYGKENNYNIILFPKNSCWLLMPSSATENTILIPTKTVVDLNGSTLQVSQDNVIPIYRLIGFEQGAEHSKLCNGTFIGDRYNTNISDNHSGNTECLWLSGNSNTIERMTIKDSLGDGIIIDGSIIITQARINGSSYFANNSYVTGEAVANTKVLSTSELLTLSDYYKGIGDFLVDFHYTSVNGTAIHPSFSNTTIYFYDSDGLLIETLTTRTNRALEKTKIPKNAISFRIEVSLDAEITSFTGNWYLLEIYGANNCGVVDCIIDNNRRNGVTIAQSNGCFIDNSIICNTNGFLPKRGIDFEPEWGIVTDFTLSKTTFYGNEAGATACVGAYGLEVKECHFMENGQFTGSRNLHVDKCTFEDSYAFSGRAQHYGKNYCMHQAIIENCIFRCKNKSAVTGGIIFKNNSFYGIVSIESHSAKLIDNVFYNNVISIYVEEVIRNKFYGKQAISIGCGKFIGNYIESTGKIGLYLNKFTPIGNTFVFKDNYLNVVAQPCIIFAISPKAKRYVFENNIFTFGELTKVTNFISKYNSVVMPEDTSFIWENNCFDLPITINYDITSGTLGVTNKDNVYVGYNQNLTVNVTGSEATE